jgi:hypothetical protein
MAAEPDALGPISYLVVEFPDNRMTGDGSRMLVDLVDRGVIRILDLVFTAGVAADGSMRALALATTSTTTVSSISRSSTVRRPVLLDASDLTDAAAIIDRDRRPGS